MVYKTPMTRHYWTHFSTIIFIHALILLGGWQFARNPELVSNAASSINATIVRIASATKALAPTPKPRPAPSKTAKPLPAPQQPVAQESTPTTAPVAESGVSTAVRADMRSLFLGELRAKIEENKNYPMMSRRLGQTGIVEVAFTLTQDGHIINARIVSPSRYDRLNESALEAVKKVTRFKPIPSELKEEKMDVTIPVKFAIL